MHRLAPLLLSLLLTLAACTSPGDPGSSMYDSACERTGCPEGTTCDTAEGRCVPDAECVDADDDGFGEGCVLGPDCDDTTSFTNPAIDEICDGIDNDCDGRVDQGNVCESCAPQCEPGARECQGDLAWRECDLVDGCARWLPLAYCEQQCIDGACTTPCDDFDGDGYGEGCALGTDCDDRNPFAYPGNREVCDGYDNDCRGGIDDGGVCDVMCPPPPCQQGARRCEDPSRYVVCTGDADGCLAWSAPLPCRGDLSCDQGQCVLADVCTDLDGDGYGSGDACSGLDCDDDDPSIHPTAAEVCDAVDNDCDGQIDEGLTGCASTLCQPPNDSMTTALPLPVGQTLASATCGNAERFFRLTGNPTPGALLALASRDGDGAPLALTLYRGDMVLASDTGTTAALSMPLDIGAAALFLGVSDAQGGTAPFRVTWLASDAVSCQDDAHEPNNSPAAATPSAPDRHVVAGACTNDLDFYALDGPSGASVISAHMLWPAQRGEPSLALWQGGVAVTPDQRLRPGLRTAHLRLDSTSSVEAVVRLGTDSPYLLALHAWPAPACTDDGHDLGAAPDDDIPNASPLNAGRAVQGTLCAGDVDIFDLGRRSPGDSVDVLIEFDAARVNLDAYLFRDSLDGFAQLANTDSAPERLPTGLSQAGHYYVMVYGRTATDQGSYTITSR